jgi:RimJ/RimL family protein N-acetyltransferase
VGQIRLPRPSPGTDSLPVNFGRLDATQRTHPSCHEQNLETFLLQVLNRKAQDQPMVETTTSQTTRVELTSFGREDFARLMSFLPTEDDLIEWCAAFFRYPLDDSQLERYLDSAKMPNTRVILTARAKEEGPVGHIEISHIWPHLSSRLSRVLIAPDKRRKGFGAAMVREAVSLSFELHHVVRIDLGVSAANHAAIGCYSKLRFEQVGLWLNAIAVGSRRIDVVWMTLTREAWSHFSSGLANDR